MQNQYALQYKPQLKSDLPNNSNNARNLKRKAIAVFGGTSLLGAAAIIGIYFATRDTTTETETGVQENN